MLEVPFNTIMIFLYTNQFRLKLLIIKSYSPVFIVERVLYVTFRCINRITQSPSTGDPLCFPFPLAVAGNTCTTCIRANEGPNHQEAVSEVHKPLVISFNPHKFAPKVILVEKCAIVAPSSVLFPASSEEFSAVNPPIRHLRLRIHVYEVQPSPS